MQSTAASQSRIAFLQVDSGHTHESQTFLAQHQQEEGSKLALGLSLLLAPRQRQLSDSQLASDFLLQPETTLSYWLKALFQQIGSVAFASSSAFCFCLNSCLSLPRLCLRLSSSTCQRARSVHQHARQAWRFASAEGIATTGQTPRPRCTWFSWSRASLYQHTLRATAHRCRILPQRARQGLQRRSQHVGPIHCHQPRTCHDRCRASPSSLQRCTGGSESHAGHLCRDRHRTRSHLPQNSSHRATTRTCSSSSTSLSEHLCLSNARSERADLPAAVVNIVPSPSAHHGDGQHPSVSISITTSCTHLGLSDGTSGLNRTSHT